MYTNKHISTDYGGNLTAAAASGQSVAFPPGSYMFTGAEVFATNTKFVGAGCDLTSFYNDNAASIQVAGADATTYVRQVGFHDCNFVTNTTSSNPFFNLENLAEFRMDNIKVYCPNRQFAVLNNVIGADFINLYVTQALAGLSIGLTSSCGRLHFDSLVLRDITNTALTVAGVIGITFDSPKIMKSNKGLLIAPNSTSGVLSQFYMSNFRFSNTPNAIHYNATATSTTTPIAQGIKFSDGQIIGDGTGSLAGIVLNALTSGIVDDVVIENTEIQGFNAGGIYIYNGSNIRLIDNTVFSNSVGAVGSYPGLRIDSNALHTRVEGGRYGETDGSTAKQSYGIINSSTSTRIRGVQARNNVTGRVLDNTRSLL